MLGLHPHPNDFKKRFLKNTSLTFLQEGIDVYAALLNTGITTPKSTLLEILCTLETKMSLVW
jgi:hypothetical protein